MRKILLILSFIIATGSFAATPINNASFEAGFSPRGDSLQLVLKAIDSAKKSIHVAAYSFTSKPIATALVSAYKRGVDVQVIADKKSNSGKYTAVTYLATRYFIISLW